jgi:hypothetical protein
LLMDAIAPLAQVARYGDVRKTDVDAVSRVIESLFIRVVAGISGACSSMNDDAAESMKARIEGVHRALGLIDNLHQRASWNDALTKVANNDHVHGLVSGRAARLLSDNGSFSNDATARALSQALSRGASPERSAAWVEGFLAGGALVLLHDRPLLTLIDQWVASVERTVFDDLSPLLRRTFSELAAMERRMLAEALSRGTVVPLGEPTRAVNASRAAAVLPRFFELIGVPL